MVSPVPEKSVTILDDLERRVKALASISPERYVSIRLDQLTALIDIARAAKALAYEIGLTNAAPGSMTNVEKGFLSALARLEGEK